MGPSSQGLSPALVKLVTAEAGYLEPQPAPDDPTALELAVIATDAAEAAAYAERRLRLVLGSVECESWDCEALRVTADLTSR